MTALTPHNINSKIEKTIAQRLSKVGNINTMQAVIIFVSIFGAILLGGMIIFMMFKRSE